MNFFATFVNIQTDPYQIPNGNFPPLIITDEQRVMQVLLGLQSNALKFTQKGKVEIKIEFISSEIDETENYLSISVIDTGIGIDK